MGSGLRASARHRDARMRKLLKRLAATPMRHSDYLLSFVLARLIFLVLEVGRSSFCRGCLATRRKARYRNGVAAPHRRVRVFRHGLLLASRATTLEGVSGLMNLVMMPMWLLSGTFFSSERFPAFLQPFIKVLPLTALNDALRAVMNEGTTLADNLTPLCVLLAWAVLSFIIALKVFRWQ